MRGSVPGAGPGWTADCLRRADYGGLREAGWPPLGGHRRPTGPPATGTNAYGLLAKENHILIFDQQVSTNSSIGQCFALDLRKRHHQVRTVLLPRRTAEPGRGSVKMLILAIREDNFHS